MSQPNSESKVRQLRESVAEAVRMARAGKRMSQVEVAAQAGASPARVSELETGHSDPRLSTLARIAHVLGIRITISLDEAA